MPSLGTSLNNLLQSFLSLLTSIFTGLLSIFQTILASFQTALTSTFDLARAILNFFISNLFLMALIAASFVAYTFYLNKQRQAGKRPIINVPGSGPTSAGGILGEKH